MNTIDKLIANFNSIFNRSVNYPNRTDNYYLTQFYQELKTTYWTVLTTAQQNGLTGKLLGYQERLRQLEAGNVMPAYDPTPIQTATDVQTASFALTSADTVIIPLLNIAVPKQYLAYGAAAAGSILAFTIIDKVVKK